jgi:hypothetical protein
MLNWLSKEFLLAIISALAIALIAVSWGGTPSQYIHPPAGQGSENSQGNQATADQTKILQIECDPNCTAKNSDELRNPRSFVRVINKIVDDPITSGILIANFLLVIGVILQVRESRRSSERQLRAYLSVVIGAAVYQDRTLDLKFEAKPLILNNGDTPAYHVRVSIKSNILTDEQALTFVFTEPPDAPQSQASIGPKENRITSAILDRFVPDDQIDDICNGKGKALYVWGTVRYEDAFGHRRFTQFAQRLWWLRDRSNVMGNYDGRFGLSD